MKPVKVFKMGLKVRPNEENISSYWIEMLKEMGVQYGHIVGRRGTRGPARVEWTDHKGVVVYATHQRVGRDYSELFHYENEE